MSNKRMFSTKITSSARFIKMPLESQALYFHLCMDADDDGVVEAFSVMRKTNAVEDSLNVLVARSFVKVLNEDLVSYIIDWREHNMLRADRKVDSIYKELLLQVLPKTRLLKPLKRADTKVKTSSHRMDGQWTDNGRLRLDKVRLDKNRIGYINPKGQNSLSYKETKKDRKQELLDQANAWRDDIKLE